MFETSPCGITIITPTGTIVAANPTLCAITGHGRQELCGRGLEEAVGVRGLLARTIADLRPSGALDSVQIERESRHASGQRLALEMTIAPLRSGDEDEQLFVVQILDVTTQRRAEERLKVSDALLHAATHDYLTGLSNRRTLESTGLDGLDRDQVVLFIDMDGFKSINDAYGHAVGDEVLILLSRRLQSFVGPHGLACRWSGDEFVAVVPHPASESLEPVTTSVRGILEQPVKSSAGSIEVRVSVGTVAMENAEALTDAIVRADIEAYTDKRASESPRVS